MNKFSQKSLERLNTCHPILINIFTEVLKIMDITILEGYRNKFAQNKAYDRGYSQLRYPRSKHNQKPSVAIDVAPYPIDWENTDRFFYLAGLVQGISASYETKIRWGGDWDSDNDFNDQSFNDYPHFEIKDIPYL